MSTTRNGIRVGERGGFASPPTSRTHDLHFHQDGWCFSRRIATTMIPRTHIHSISVVSMFSRGGWAWGWEHA